MISGSAPASRTARAESYSQLVPGNAGMSTLGFATLIEEVTMFAVFVALLASGLFAGIIAGVIFAIMGHGITGLALIGCGLASIGVSIFFFYLGKVLAILSKNIVLGLKEYFLKGRA